MIIIISMIGGVPGPPMHSHRTKVHTYAHSHHLNPPPPHLGEKDIQGYTPPISGIGYRWQLHHTHEIGKSSRDYGQKIPSLYAHTAPLCIRVGARGGVIACRRRNYCIVIRCDCRPELSNRN